MVQSSAAVFLVEQIVRLRSVTNRAARRGWRPEPCARCGAGEQVLCLALVLQPGEVIEAATDVPEDTTLCARGCNADTCEQVLYCEPCGHSCCEPCMWRVLCESAESDDGAETASPNPGPNPNPNPNPNPDPDPDPNRILILTLSRRGDRVPQLRRSRHAAAAAARLDRPGPAPGHTGHGSGERAAR